MRSIKIIFPFLFLFLFTACEKDFEEINQNPFDPTETEIGPLFNSVISSLQLGWNEQFYLHNEKLYQVTQQAALTAESFQNFSIGTEDVWANYYSALADIREIERRLDAHEGDQEATNNVRAQLLIIRAYKTFRLTDLFGAIPYFDAGKGFESTDFVRPKFDSQESIYRSLLEDLEWAVNNMNFDGVPVTESGEAYLNINGFDNLFSNFLFRWEAFANSLRLRHALRMAEVDEAYAAEIVAEIINSSAPLIDVGQDVLMTPRQQNWLNQGVNWSFREHNKLRMGSTIWNLLSENDNTDGSGIYDLRAHLFFDTNNDNEWVAFPQIPAAGIEPSGGIPYQQQRDGNYGFKGMSNIYSAFEYYLIRDERDIPEIIMTAAEVHFIKAELYMRGIGVSQNENEAESQYLQGLTESFAFWQKVMLNSEIWVQQPTVIPFSELFTIANHPNLNIFTSEDKLKLIYEQRWMDAFRQPWEAFSLLRRTNATPRQGPDNTFYRFTYPPSETTNNPTNWSSQVGIMGGDETTTKLWWMP